MEETKNIQISSGAELANEIYAMKELIMIIVDYYCVRNNIIDDEDMEDGDEWKRGTKYQGNIDGTNIIPEQIHNLIEKSFETQLKKFSK